MTIRQAGSIDYTAECTVCIIYDQAGVESRIVYERPQMQIPNRPLTASERAQILRLPNDEALTVEAKAVSRT
jgi:hypothetical protein